MKNALKARMQLQTNEDGHPQGNETMRLITRFGVADRHSNAIIDDNFWAALLIDNYFSVAASPPRNLLIVH